MSYVGIGFRVRGPVNSLTGGVGFSLLGAFFGRRRRVAEDDDVGGAAVGGVLGSYESVDVTGLIRGADLVVGWFNCAPHEKRGWIRPPQKIGAAGLTGCKAEEGDGEVGGVVCKCL